MNNLKQISLGLLNFEDQHHTFTPAFMADKNDKPLLSWRMLILPFLEENELFNQFKLDEPWDSDNNKKLIEKMPRVYAAPESKAAAEFKTVYLGVRRKLGHSRVFKARSSLRLPTALRERLPSSKPPTIKRSSGPSPMISNPMRKTRLPASSAYALADFWPRLPMDMCR